MPRRTSTASLRDQCAAPDLNREFARSVFRAGPQPRVCEISVACRTSTASLRDQCCVPDLNRESARSVLRAGPQPRVCEISVACRTSTGSCEFSVMAGPQQKICQKDMSERISEDMSERMSKDMSERMSEDMSERMATDMSERMSERMSKDMSERMSEDMSERHARKNKTIDKQLTHQLLTVPNPHRTGKLQGMLLVHENMIVRLSDVLAPHLGLVKDKLAMVVKVDLHHEDQERLRHREPGFCHFVPEYMAKGIWVKLLKGKSSPMEDALLKTWEEQFENVFDHADDAKKLFFVELTHAEFKIDLKIGDDNEKIEVIRWQFPLLHGMLRTAYSAQGLTLDGGVLVDLRRAGGLEDDDWWLAIYVMLTRARKLENLILLGFTEQVEDLLRRGPPTYLRALTDKLEAKAATTLERLQSWPDYDALQAG